MLIVSWNVAGLSTTVNRIHEAYGPRPSNGEPARKKSLRIQPSVAMAEFLRRHQADIFCVQEHKIPESQLKSRSEPRGCASIEGYESFWSCNRCTDKNKKGLNGVVTYVKKGMVMSADAHVLGSDDLDEQGRCVMTDHGSFVVFNVYVPAGGGQPLSYKMKFLEALRKAMQYQRVQRKKSVILCGDLNIKHSAIDCFWKDRIIRVPEILEEVTNTSDKKSLETWKVELWSAWPDIMKSLETKTVIRTKTTNSLTGQTYQKYRMTVTGRNGERVYLGGHELSPEYCEYFYDFDAWRYTCATTGNDIQAAEENSISIAVVAELMQKIAGVQWDDNFLRQLSKEAATVCSVSPSRRWLASILCEDNMVDTFRYFYPTAEGRFTCWHQLTNRRYYNEGSRIDYVIVDAHLVKYVQKGDVSGLRSGESECDFLSEDAALMAATANGHYQPVSYEGGGIQEASQTVLDTQFGTPHTGMIYTPPSFSDHIAVSLLVDDSIVSQNLVLTVKDSATRKAQPHKMQPSIASFFGAPAQSKSSANNPRKTALPIAHKAKKASASMKDFFKPVVSGGNRK